jgi:hypothetical protein
VTLFERVLLVIAFLAAAGAAAVVASCGPVTPLPVLNDPGADPTALPKPTIDHPLGMRPGGCRRPCPPDGGYLTPVEPQAAHILDDCCYDSTGDTWSSCAWNRAHGGPVPGARRGDGGVN